MQYNTVKPLRGGPSLRAPGAPTGGPADRSSKKFKNFQKNFDSVANATE